MPPYGLFPLTDVTFWCLVNEYELIVLAKARFQYSGRAMLSTVSTFVTAASVLNCLLRRKARHDGLWDWVQSKSAR